MIVSNPLLKNVDMIFSRKNDYNSIINKSKEVVGKAVNLINYEIVEMGVVPTKINKSEISATLKDKLVIKVKDKKEEEEVDLSLFVPSLIDDNFLIINGNRKIPLWQLIDLPIVCKDSTEYTFRNRCFMTILSKDNNDEFIYNLKFNNVKIPFALALIASFNRDELLKKFDNYKDHILLKEINKLYSTISYEKNEIITYLGKMFTKYNARKRAESILFSLNNVLKIDIVSSSFYNNDNLLMLFLDTVLNNIVYDSEDYKNKRVRCFEYIILDVVIKNMFNFCLSVISGNKKFNINSNEIINQCNVSDIVHYNFTINPIDQLTKFSRCSLKGPIGFSQDNVRIKLRNVHPSMFCKVCPVDTPDRDNCGVILSLTPGVEIKQDGKFGEQSELPTSVSISMVPFLKNDDATRLQMAASQMRQAVMLKEPQIPLVQSGYESSFTHYTEYVKVSKNDGSVLFANDSIIIVKYDNDEIDVFKTGYRKIYMNIIDVYETYVKTGDKVTKGQILAESNFCKNKIMRLGRNALTSIQIFYGYNYEDAIIVSEKFAKEMTSIHYVDLSFHLKPDRVLLSLSDDEYKPLPQIGDVIKKGNPYAITKIIPDEASNYRDTFDHKVKLSPRDVIIVDVKIYPNNWNKQIVKFDKFIKETLQKQIEEENKIYSLLENYLGKQDIDKIFKSQWGSRSDVSRFKDKKKDIEGVYVEIYGIYVKELEVGDKLANRHGNKGVISTILPYEKMPKIGNKHADIIINPLGIIGRMNVGQLYELHLGMAIENFKERLRKKLNDNVSQKEIKEDIINLVSIIDNTNDNRLTKQYRELVEKYTINSEFIDNFYIVQPPFESCSYEQLKRVMDYTNTKFLYEVIDGISGKKLENPIAVGYMYWMKLIHMASEKIAARSIFTYNKRTMQPLSGKKNKGGQRLGEMETACLIAHGAIENLNEFHGVKSDAVEAKNHYIRNELTGIKIPTKKEDFIPESVKLLLNYLKLIGVNINKEE